jgi:hypothetical protein
MEVGKLEFGPDVDHKISDEVAARSYYHGREEQIMDIPKTTVLTAGGHPRFNELLIELSKLHAKKNSDYANDKPLSNFQECENFGVSAPLGILVRLSDKWSRIKSIIKKGSTEVKDESLLDTLKDMAAYSLLTIILMEESGIDTSTTEKKC